MREAGAGWRCPRSARHRPERGFARAMWFRPPAWRHIDHAARVRFVAPGLCLAAASLAGRCGGAPDMCRPFAAAAMPRASDTACIGTTTIGRPGFRRSGRDLGRVEPSTIGDWPTIATQSVDMAKSGLALDQTACSGQVRPRELTVRAAMPARFFVNDDQHADRARCGTRPTRAMRDLALDAVLGGPSTEAQPLARRSQAFNAPPFEN